SRAADGTLSGTWAGVVARMDDGSLGSIGQYVGFWVADGVLYADLRPPSRYALGDLRAYRWSGTGFIAVPQTRYPPLQPTTDSTAPVVVLGPVAAALGCPE